MSKVPVCRGGIGMYGIVKRRSVEEMVVAKGPPFLKKNLDASRHSEHPPVRGENVKTFRWDHRLQRPSLFMAFRVPRWW